MSDQYRRREARLTPEACDGWDALARAAGSGRPTYAGLAQAIGEYLNVHGGRLWELTEPQTRRLVERAFEIDEERRRRR